MSAIERGRRLALREFRKALASHGTVMDWRRKIAEDGERDASDIAEAYGRPDPVEGEVPDYNNPEIYEQVEGGIRVWIPSFAPYVDAYDEVLQTQGDLKVKARLEDAIKQDDVLLHEGTVYFVDACDVPSVAVCKDLTLRRPK